MKTRRVDLRVYHRRPFTPAHRGNSYRGLLAAVAKRYNAIDLDMLVSFDGVLVCTHWQDLRKDGYRSTTGINLDRRRTKRLTMDELRTCEARDHDKKRKRPYRLRSIREMFEQASRLRHLTGTALTLCLEVKPDPRFRKPETYVPLLRWDLRYGVPFVVMSQPRGGVGYDYLDAARAAGCRVMVQRRGPVRWDRLRAGDLVKTGPWVREVRA